MLGIKGARSPSDASRSCARIARCWIIQRLPQSELHDADGHVRWLLSCALTPYIMDIVLEDAAYV
jgi:hypothetical protein